MRTKRNDKGSHTFYERVSSMRFVLVPAVVCLAVLAATCSGKAKNLPPPERFYFPSGIHHARSSPAGEGVLYVVNANFDRRYDTGTMTAVDLDTVGLPAFGSFPDGGSPLPLTDLMVDGGSMVIQLANFGADMGTTTLPDGTVRMFIPSRAEGQKIMVVDAKGTSLSCVPTLWADGGSRGEPRDPRDCGEVGASLVEYERGPTGIPRADSPLSATVDRDNVVWIASARHADTPRFSQMMFNDFVVRMPMSEMKVALENFIGLGPGSTHAVVAGQKWVYFSGRFPSAITNPPLLRMVHRTTNEVLPALLEVDARIAEARGIALSSDERLVFLAGRQPSGVTGSDHLVVASISDPLSDAPVVSVQRIIPIPAEPLMVKTIPRGPGRQDLVVVACGFQAGSLAIYDEERLNVVAQVDGIGLQASSIAIDVRPNGPATGARIYVSAFTDGRVAVVDVPNLNRPEDARIVAHLGAQQPCITRPRDFTCPDAGVVP